MPSCIHVFLKGPKKGTVCRNESPQDKCYKHRDLVEFKCEGEDDSIPCELMTTNVSHRCNKHQFRNKKLLDFKEANDLPLSNVDKIQKITDILKRDPTLIDLILENLSKRVSDEI